MRVHVVSDVHGSVEAVARAGDGADALIVLGDLIEFVDYHDPAAGIIGRVLGARVSAEFGRLRAHGAPGELVRFISAQWARLPDPAAVVAEAIHEQYERIFGALSAPTWAIPGNVDEPSLWADFVRPGLCLPDGTVVRIGGLRFGFVGGVPLPPGRRPHGGGPWAPHLRTAEEYTAAVRALDPLDVLCSHAPPSVPELVFDVVSRRAEAGAPALLERIGRDRPRAALFGHVHQPLASRVRLGRTECVNVGHFQRSGRPYVLRWPT